MFTVKVILILPLNNRVKKRKMSFFLILFEFNSSLLFSSILCLFSSLLATWFILAFYLAYCLAFWHSFIIETSMKNHTYLISGTSINCVSGKCFLI